jgi:hypothetical protein
MLVRCGKQGLVLPRDAEDVVHESETDADQDDRQRG